jgi:hypothetical protein
VLKLPDLLFHTRFQGNLSISEDLGGYSEFQGDGNDDGDTDHPLVEELFAYQIDDNFF